MSHFRPVDMDISKIRSLSFHFWILWFKVQFFHYNQQDRQMPINQEPFKLLTWNSYPRCKIRRSFLSCHKFDLDYVFKVTTIRKFSNLKLLKGAQTVSFALQDFIKGVDTCIEDLPNTHQQVWPLSRSQQQQTFSIEINGMHQKFIYFKFHQIRHLDIHSYVLLPIKILSQCYLVSTFLALLTCQSAKLIT